MVHAPDLGFARLQSPDRRMGNGFSMRREIRDIGILAKCMKRSIQSNLPASLKDYLT
jgi:hypothetical protein